MSNTILWSCANEFDYSFKPLIYDGLIVWGYNRDGYMGLEVLLKNAEGGMVIVDNLIPTEVLEYFIPKNGAYVIGIECEGKYRETTIDSVGNVLKREVKCGQIPVYPNDPQFRYEYKNSSFYRGDTCISNNVDLPPIILDGVIGAWLSDDKLVVSNFTYELPSITFDVQYLFGCAVGEDIYMFGGFSNVDNTLKINYYKLLDGIVYTCASRYYKCKQYKNKIFSVFPLKNGFLLFAEGNHVPITVQEFNHLGMPLYPPRKLTNDHSWDPSCDGYNCVFVQKGSIRITIIKKACEIYL